MKIAESVLDKNYIFDKLIDKLSKDIHVALPAILTEIDYEKQTCKAQAVIREFIDNEYVELPEFMDIPFFILSGGDYSITMPIQKDDECLIVFADSCIDSWWQSGGIQNPIELRNHDLSDCFALVGFRSQDKKLEDFDSESFQIRRKDKIPVKISEEAITLTNEDCEIKIEDDNINLSSKNCEVKIDKDEINISKGENVEIKIDSNNNISIKTNAKITLQGNSGVVIQEGQKAVDFFSHLHWSATDGATGWVVTGV